MVKFGDIKLKVLKRLTESYGTKNFKKEIKLVFTPIMENPILKELYSLYEELETKTFETKEIADLYVEELATILKNKTNEIQTELLEISNYLTDVVVENNDLYSAIDTLCESDRLNNIDKRVRSKSMLIGHLISEKVIETPINVTVNEGLLNAVLVDDFNALFESQLDPKQKEGLQRIISLTSDELTSEFMSLRESVYDKVNGLISEDTDTNEKVGKVRSEVSLMSPSRYNVYRLMDLDEGLS